MAIVQIVLSNISGIFLILAGLWTDLLVIRIFLSCGYIFNIAFQSRVPSINMIVLGVVGLYVHLSSAVRLVLDEGPIELNEEDELLWRVFYRSSGLSRLLFKKHISKYFQLVTLKKETKLNVEEYIFIILDGTVGAEITVNNKALPLTLVSGEVFGLKHMRVHQKIPSIYSSVRRQAPLTDAIVQATTLIDSKVFMCTAKDMEQLSNKPNLKTAWMGLLICMLSDIAESPWKFNPTIIVNKDDGPFRTTTHERSAIFSPLEEWEKPPCYLAGSGSSLWVFDKQLLYNLRVRFQLPWPFMAWNSGIRHIDSLPVPHYEEQPRAIIIK